MVVDFYHNDENADGEEGSDDCADRMCSHRCVYGAEFDIMVGETAAGRYDSETESWRGECEDEGDENDIYDYWDDGKNE